MRSATLLALIPNLPTKTAIEGVRRLEVGNDELQPALSGGALGPIGRLLVRGLLRLLGSSVGNAGGSTVHAHLHRVDRRPAPVGDPHDLV
eukprot:881857-Alexandrium_andersonii.AAC.1